MRILMISALEVWALAGQGGAPSLYKTLQGIAGRRHEVDFVSSTIGANHHHDEPEMPPPPIDGVRYRLFHLPSLGESRLPWPGLARKTDQKLRFAVLFPRLAAHEADQLLRRGGYDLVYGYEVHGVLAAARLRKYGLPLVARFQGTVMHPYLDKPASLARKYEEVAALRTPAELYIMTNDGTQGDEVLRRLNPASQGKVRFWRNGLDLDKVRAPSAHEAALARSELGLSDAELVLVTAVRLARWKRVDRAIDALAALRAQGVQVRLLIVGDGEERANLQQQARDLGLAEQVRFVGAVRQEEVQRYLWAADVFLSLNELSNVGNPLLEAMQAGCCILTLDEGDTRELIKDDVTGVLLANGEPRAIAGALAALAGDPERRGRLGAAARSYAEANFWSWQQRIDAEVDALETLVGAKAGRSVDVQP
jgi:glycosyltransferase involved in cell wall biosynthesis